MANGAGSQSTTPRLIAGRYQELAHLGNAGVCGQTLRCYDVVEQSEVAVKMIEMHNGLVGPWDEARYLRRLADPHILPIRNAVEDLGQPILVTEIAAGGTVADRLDQTIGVSPLQAIDWIRQACLGVARAHGDGLLHNDIKPANLFLTQTGLLMVGDFGFATLIDPDTGTARMLGTSPTTGAPEAITGALTQTSTATPRSDVYSLGATLYWILAGQPPVPATLSHQQARDYVVANRVEPIKVIAPHVSDYTSRIVAQAMSVDAAQRHSSVSELHTVLGSARTSESTGRQWRRCHIHDGHDSCWQCPPEEGKQGLTLCVIPGTTSQLDIRVQYSTTGRRLQATQTTRVKKPGDLRRLFKSL
ncbi:serine/threonine protein kinase [Mycobacterium avium]